MSGSFDARNAAQSIAPRLDSGIVVIDGPSGAGKSTFSDHLMRELLKNGAKARLIRTDDFATWDDPAGWWPELETDVLQSFSRGHDFRYHRRVWIDGTPSIGPRVWLRWEPLLIIEGVTSARRAITRYRHCAFWINGGTPAQRLERAVARDGESQRRNLQRWQQFEAGWFAVDDTRSRCAVLD